jgi:hypothetical protein
MNNPIEIYHVKSWLDRRRFITFAWRVYKHDPLWVPPLVPERMKMLNPKTSQFLTHSRADFFIAYKNGQPAGTIMAANDVSSNRLRKIKECMIGFFECIDDQAVANALFNARPTTRSQLRSHPCVLPETVRILRLHPPATG